MVHLSKEDILEDTRHPFMDDSSKYYSWRGHNIHYKDEGNGTPIVLLHGTSSSLDTWDQLVINLKHHYRVIRPDLIGFGLTGPHNASNYSLEAYQQFIFDFTQFLGLDSFFIGGNSWGGLLCWNFASSHQKNLLGLILINSAGFKLHKVPKRFVLSQFGLGRWLLKNLSFKWFVKEGLKEVFHSKALICTNTINRYHKLLLRQGNRKAFLEFIRQRDRVDTSILSRIKIPTLILWGSEDKLYPLYQGFIFKRKIKNSYLKIIEKSGHIPMEESPTPCYIEINRFITNLKQKKNV
ncbi:MAG: alpha/beta fold hydrolase [Allomuricauda sp.]